MISKLSSSKKRIAMLIMTAMMLCLCSVPVLASGETGGMAGVESALETSFSSIGSSMTSIVGKILPIALPIMGAVLLVGFGIKVFKKISGKA